MHKLNKIILILTVKIANKLIQVLIITSITIDLIVVLTIIIAIKSKSQIVILFGIFSGNIAVYCISIGKPLFRALILSETSVRAVLRFSRLVLAFFSENICIVSPRNLCAR